MNSPAPTPRTSASSPTPCWSAPAAATTSRCSCCVTTVWPYGRCASWTVWRVPEAVGHARRFTRRTLRAWGVPQRDADTVLLVVSELVTNALVHTDGRVRLDLTFVNHRVRVAVADASPRTPVKPASLSWEATGGRGILLVEAMSAAWGTVPVSGGKQVWSEIAASD